MCVAQSCLILYNSMDCSPPGSFVHGNSPGKNTRVGCHALLQGIFLTQESSPGLLHLQEDSLPSEPPGKQWQIQGQLVSFFSPNYWWGQMSVKMVEWVAWRNCPFIETPKKWTKTVRINFVRTLGSSQRFIATKRALSQEKCVCCVLA